MLTQSSLSKVRPVQGTRRPKSVRMGSVVTFAGSLTNSLIIQLLDLLKRRLLDVPNCRRRSIPRVCTAMKPGRTAAAVMAGPLSVLRMCAADCFESRVGVVIVREQFIEVDFVVADCVVSGEIWVVSECDDCLLREKGVKGSTELRRSCSLSYL